ncbi:MAG: transposase [Planctomycetota bacterium]
MGEARKDAFRLDFDRRLKLEFHGTMVTSDAGLLAYREIDEALGLTSAIDSELRNNRMGKNTRHSIAALLRQSIYSRLACYDDTNDVERLCVDPAMRHIAGGRAIERSAASTSAMGRFETEILTQSKSLELLMNLTGEWIDRVHQRKSLKQIILDGENYGL